MRERVFSIMPMNSGRDYKARETDIAQPLMAGGPVGGNQGGDFVVQARTVALRGRDEGGAIELGGEQANALRASSGGGDKPYVLASVICFDDLRRFNHPHGGFAHGELFPTLENTNPKQLVAIPMAFVQNTRDEVRLMNGDGSIIGALSAHPGMKQQAYIAAPTMAVRRLMPVECERLQGFPDGYTDVPVGKKQAADGPRYKQLGNSWAVPCVTWIGRRIQAEVDRLNTLCESGGVGNTDSIDIVDVTENRDSDFDLTLVLWALAA